MTVDKGNWTVPDAADLNTAARAYLASIDLGAGPCVCQPFLEEQPSSHVMVCHHSLDGRELTEPDHTQGIAR